MTIVECDWCHVTVTIENGTRYMHPQHPGTYTLTFTTTGNR